MVALTLEPPGNEATHWTARDMAKAVGIAASPVVKIWHDHGLAPHRWRSFKLSNGQGTTAPPQNCIKSAAETLFDAYS